MSDSKPETQRWFYTQVSNAGSPVTKMKRLTAVPSTQFILETTFLAGFLRTTWFFPGPGEVVDIAQLHSSSHQRGGKKRSKS
jgi:hypothetical protein